MDLRTSDNVKVQGIFKDRSLMVDQSLFELPFAHPRDMSLLYQKYGLNQKGFAPFFEPSLYEMI